MTSNNDNVYSIGGGKFGVDINSIKRGRKIVESTRWVHASQNDKSGYGYPIISNTSAFMAIYMWHTQLDKKLTPTNEAFDPGFNYTDYVNSWAYANDLVYEKSTQRQRISEGRRIWEYERTMAATGRTMIGYGISTTLKQAKMLCDFAIYSEGITLPICQMDGDNSKESVQGLAIQDSDKSSNTIVTRDEDQTVSSTDNEIKPLTFVSTEKTVAMPDVTSRWMPLKTFRISIADVFNTTKVTYYLPETIYPEMCQSINLLPFEAFIYGKYDIVMKFVVNANKFQCGKILVSAKFDSYQADAMQNHVLSGLHRPHVMLDLATNVEGELRIPFRYHRSMLRNVKNDSHSVGVRPSKYATVLVQVLSPLRTGRDGATDVYIRPFVKLVDSHFAGMSYRVKVQMDTLSTTLKSALPTQEVRGVLQSAEKLLRTLGTTANRDKPTSIGGTIVIPKPRLNFSTGKGLIDALPLRLNPYAMTTFSHVRPFDDEPKTSLDIARIWGLRSRATWKSSQAPSDVLIDMVIDPSVRNYNTNYDGIPTPLEYITGMYQFWAGTIEVRIDFISNAFHTGAIMLAAEFGRPTEGTQESECDMASTYTKTFHLGEQKSVTFTVPYIYDTVWRRTNTLAYQPNVDKPHATDNMKSYATNVRADSRTRFKVRVINELRPVQTVTQEIELLVYWRASSEFMLHGLKQHSYYLTRETTGQAPSIDNFPADGYKPVTPDPRTRDDNEVERHRRELTAYQLKKTHDVPEEIANEWNEVAARPRVQMDTGDKEAEDSTLDFAQGKFNLPLQTTDSQLSLKDILRRPVLLVNRLKVKPFTNASPTMLWIPLMPPSREMNWHGSQNEVFSQLIGQTPQAAIMNLFRFWRGSMRYTIVVEGTEQGVIYVTHVPHTGTRIIGQRYIGQPSTSEDRPIYGTGLTTEMLVPSVNKTMVVEAPYDTENDWTLTFEEDAQRNYSWRDKADTNSGHLVITTHQTTTLTIWWSAGDDFEIGNFYGIPECKMDDHMYQWNDTHARVQMDFNEFDSSHLRRTISNIKTPALMAAATSIPIIGTPIAIGYGAYKAERVLDKVEDTVETWDGVGHKVDAVLDNVNEGITELRETSNEVLTQTNQCAELITTFSSRLNSMLDSLTAGLTMLPTVRTIVEHAMFDIVAAWMTESWVNVGIGIVRVVNQVLGGTLELARWGYKIGQALLQYVRGNPTVQLDEEVTLVGLLCAMVGSLMGVVLDANHFSEWPRKFLKIFVTTSGVSYMNQVLRFISTTFDCIKGLIMKALGLKDAKIHAIQMLCSSSDLVKEFVEQAQICMNEANTNMMLAPAFRTKFWLTTLRAYQIQRALITAGRNVVSPHLSKLCTDVIKHATEKFVDLSCSPVRYEPFVLCLVGKPGIGKSYMIDRLASDMLSSVNFNRPTAGLVYTRPPGLKFWSGYRDQPVVAYDDWINLNDNEGITQQISELYQMKSTCPFRPDMADLSEKKITGNPMVVMLACNDAFPTAISNVAIHNDAVFRRRDLVVEARLKQDWVGKNLRDTLNEEQSASLAHLEFTIYSSSTDKESKKTQYVSYDVFKPWLTATFKRYHAQEQVNVRKRLEGLESFMNLAPGAMQGDPFELLYSAQASVQEINQNSWLPSEQLEYAVHQVIDALEVARERLPIPIPPIPEPIFTQIEDNTIIGGIVKFMTAAVCGVLLTPSVSSQALSWTWEKLLSYMPESETLVQGHCVICMEDDVPIMTRCRNSTPDSPHTVCTTCYNRSRNLGRRPNCELCRSEEIEMVTTYTGKWWLVVLQWIQQKGRQYISPLIAHLVRFSDVLPYRLLLSLSALEGLVLTLITGNLDHAVARGASYLADRYMRPDTDGFQEAQEHPALAVGMTVSHMLNAGFTGARLSQAQQIVQTDEVNVFDLFGEIPPVDERNSVAHLFDPGMFNEDVFLRQPRVSTHPRCLHGQLLENVNGAVFELNPETNKSEWRIVVRSPTRGEMVYVNVEDHPCSSECPLDNIARARAFYERWRTLNLPTLRSQLAIVHNSVGSRAQRARSKIPRVLWPDWMEEPIVETMTQSWWEYLSEEYSKYKLFINVCIGVSAAAAGLYGLVKLWDMWKPVVAQADLNYNAADQRQLRRVVNPRRVIPERLRVQLEDLTNVVTDYVVRNYVILRVWKAGECVKQMVMLGICGKWVIMPRHYVNYLEQCEHEHLTIEPALYVNGKDNHMRSVFAFERSLVTEMANTDIAFMQLPNSYPSFKDIRKFFAKDEDLKGYCPNEADIILVPTKRRQTLMSKHVELMGYTSRVKFDDVDGSSFWASDVLKYSHSEAGACGSMVLIDNNQRPIRAMHVAGTTRDIGYGVLITQELLSDLTEDKVILQYDTHDLDSVAEREDAMIFDTSVRVDYMGAVPKTEIPFTPKKSKIKPSAIQTMLPPPTTQPAILTKQDARYTHEFSPLYYGAAKHGLTTIDFKQSVVDAAEQALWDSAISTMKPSVLNPKVLTIEEAVTGLKDIEFYDPMRLDTSAGYPWQLQRADTTKRAWIQVERDQDGNITEVHIDKAVLDVIEKKTQQRRAGIVPITMFCDTLKDERKSNIKVLRPGATRVFCASPIDYTISTRQNLLHFCAAFMKKRLNAHHAVGINAKGPEWTELYRRLTEVSPFNIVMMDYSNFGPAFNSVVAQSAVNLMVRWTMKHVAGVNETELRALLMECVNSVHIAGATVYRQFAGSPSGAPITTIINTLVNLLYLTIAWQQLCGERAQTLHPDIYHVFRKKTALFAYGDDFIMSVHDDFKDIFNTNTIRNFFAQYGIAATSADKELTTMPDFVRINDASFLKRTFRKHDTRPEMVLGPLDRSALDEIPKWIWQSANSHLATRVNVESALLEAHAWGPQFFEKWKEELNECLGKLNIETTSMQWKALDEQWFKGEMPLIDII